MTLRLFMAAGAGLLVCAFSGCGRKNVSVGQNDYIGVWIQSSGVVNPTLLRRLEINADGTWKLTLCDGQRKPLSPAQFAEGTWTLEGNVLRFECQTRKFDEKFKGSEPVSAAFVSLKKAGDAADRLLAPDAAETKHYYVRAEGS